MAELKTYNSRRNFDITSEPEGKVRSSGRKLKFSVQRHAAKKDHYDFRLEWAGVALSWAVPKGPSFCTSDKRLAVRVEDHPVDYMDFEGIIPKGEYGGGTVMLWDEGEWIPRADPERGLDEGSLKFRLKGSRLKGDWALVRMKSEDKSEPWLLIKEKDEFAKDKAGIEKFTRGVRSGKSMAEITRSGQVNPFEKVKVMLAKPCRNLPEGSGWLFELKYDGHRTVAFSQDGKTALITRNGLDCTRKFSAAGEGVTRMLNGRAAVLDGEMVAVGENGIPDFAALQAFSKNGKATLNYVLFDLLALDGKDLRNLPLCERKQKLKALIKNAPPVLTFSEHTQRISAANLKQLKNKNIEGVVAKKANSPYSSGRNGDWLKLKFRNSDEFIVGGYLLSGSGELRSLLVGYFKQGVLTFAGGVGTGFTQSDRRELIKLLTPLSRKTSPFRPEPKEFAGGAHWVRPTVAVQAEYAEITPYGLLRQASYKGIRGDKNTDEIVCENLREVKRSSPSQKGDKQVGGIVVTHPEKVMFSDPIITKLELIEYYQRAAERMLPYIKDRFLSLVCCPSGTDGEKFFRRHIEGKFAGVSNAQTQDGYFYLTDEKGVISLAQYNAVEFHVWGSRKSASYRPDVMVFDLDPDENLSLSAVRRGVRDLKKTLDGLGLKSFLKTSGGKGYHVVVPLRTGADSQVFRDFAKRVAELLESAYPARYTSNMSKKAREGKIFIDWQRNSPGATWVAPYSVRARAGAPVSMPIAWEELSKVAPAGVNIKSALRRLRNPDPWADYFKVKRTQSLKSED